MNGNLPGVNAPRVGGGSGHREGGDVRPWWGDLSIKEHVDHFVREGESVRDAIKRVAEERNMSKRDVYNDYHT